MKNEKYCDVCGQAPATVHYRSTVNGKTKEYHLCAECAKKSPIADEVSSGIFGGIADFDSLFGGLFLGSSQRAAQKKCPVCGYSLADIKERSRLGCPECYTAFASELNLPRAVKNEGYGGRRPARLGKQTAENTAAEKSAAPEKQKPREETAEELKKKLASALAEENYELCASLRDRIKALEENKDKGER